MDRLVHWELTELWDEVFVGLPHNGGPCTDVCWRPLLNEAAAVNK